MALMEAAWDQKIAGPFRRRPAQNRGLKFEETLV